MSLRGRISAASAHPQSARASAHLERYRSQDQLCMDVLVCVGSSGLSPVWVSTADQTGRYHPCRPVNKHGSSEEYCTLIHGIVRQAAPAAALDCGLTAPYSLAHMFLEFCEQSLFDAQIPVFFPCATIFSFPALYAKMKLFFRFLERKKREYESDCENIFYRYG